VDDTSVKEKLIQSWRYKNLAVIKRHKNHLSFIFMLKYIYSQNYFVSLLEPPRQNINLLNSLR